MLTGHPSNYAYVSNQPCGCPLLYFIYHFVDCHCQATTEPLDPFFRYRDCLLEELLRMERELPTDQDELRFQFFAIVNGSSDSSRRLNDISVREIMSSRGNSAAHTNSGRVSASEAQQLAIGTFRALRQDGIIHLLDHESDTYLLISCKRVLEPYIRKKLLSSTEFDASSRRRGQRPSYLSKVPKARLDVVRRSLADKIHNSASHES